jgi:hypothetical protein
MTTTYYVRSRYEPPSLLRRTESPEGLTDEMYRDGTWQPTVYIVDFMFGHDDDVDEITEDQARAMEPGAV